MAKGHEIREYAIKHGVSDHEALKALSAPPAEQPTPRTNAHRLMPAARSAPKDVVDADFARQLERELSIANKKADEEMLRVKACEHIADSDEGWEQLRNECPSTASVAALRDELSRSREDCEKLWDAAAFLRDLKTMKEALETQRGPVLTLAGGTLDRSVIQKYYDDNKERAWRNLRAALAATRKDSSNG